jgi:hypothetical protein
MRLEHNTPIEIFPIIGSNTTDPSLESYLGFLSDFKRMPISSVSHPIGSDIGLNHLGSRQYNIILRKKRMDSLPFSKFWNAFI